MRTRNLLSIAGIALLGVGTTATARVADVWYLTFDPADVVFSTVSAPQDVISFDPGDDSTATVDSLTDPPVQIDGFHRVDNTSFYFSVDTHVVVDGLVVTPADVVSSDGGSLSIAYDGDARGLADGVNIDAVARDANDHLLFSVDTHVELDGTVFEDAELIRFDGSSHTMAFKAAATGLPAGTDVNAATAFSNDRLAISTDTGGTVGGIVYDHGTVMLIDSTGNIAGIEFSAGDDVGTATDLIALSAEDVGDVIFMDRFETED